MPYLKQQTVNGKLLTGTTTAVATRPHIQPGVLYPAVANIMLDGATALSAATVGPNSSTIASSKYGTVQADGRMYYYTDIVGSKPIKDPRIGAYFGSQRHKFKSLQYLDQESAMHGKKIYSIDGREWIRTFTETVGPDMIVHNDARGHGLRGNTAAMSIVIEVVGYFNAANFICFQNDTTHLNDCDIFIDGAAVSTGGNYGTRTLNTPLEGRFVDNDSVVELDLGSTALGLHTMKFHSENTGGNAGDFSGIELIAWDTTDTASKSKIQIPPQTVVSQGKQSDVAATATHYDPFNGFTNSTDLHSAYVDTATSLGLSTAIAAHGAPWAISGTNNIRPYNGGRVVKWVDSDGTIKTSVNVMPPNAQNYTGTAAEEITTPSATNVFLPAFSDDGIDQSLAEVAKTFHWREFGNGAANGGTGAAKADSSMLKNAADSIAYVMDDGLTSFTSPAVLLDAGTGGVRISGANSRWLTFVGTGLSIKRVTNSSGSDEHDEFIDGVQVYDGARDGNTTVHTDTIAQNLPYGTHIYKIHAEAVNAYNYCFLEYTFHQPKMPPIPEDAVVLADYMLMADFVPVSGTPNEMIISKGVRFVSPSRDVLIDSTDDGTITLNHYGAGARSGFNIGSNNGADSDTSVGVRLPFFGVNWVSIGHRHDTRFKLYEGAGLSSTDKDSASTKDNTDITHSFAHLTSNLALGTYVAGVNGASGQEPSWHGFCIATPIHTSSHYQTFETPHLHELVGGDRNMEQTNLVVTPDGKTWDEVSRDSSYIGKGCLSCTTDTSHADAFVIFDNWRGAELVGRNYFNKDFAIAYDRVICLKDGQYTITAESTYVAAATTAGIYVNGVLLLQGFVFNFTSHTGVLSVQLNRNDYVQIKGRWRPDDEYTNFRIDRI